METKKYVKALQDFVDTIEKKYQSMTEEEFEAWCDQQWTITFDGHTIALDNCAGVYEGILSTVKNEIEDLS